MRIDDPVTPRLQQLYDALSGRDRVRLTRRLGKVAEVEFRKHFRQKNSQPNKRNWTKQNFWNRIRNATALTEATETHATLTVADPAYNAKLHGAIITPKWAKALTIPMREEAYGKSAREFNDLFVLKRRRGAYLARVEGKALRVYYALKKRVVVPKDPTAEPNERMLQGKIHKATNQFIERIIK